MKRRAEDEEEHVDGSDHAEEHPASDDETQEDEGERLDYSDEEDELSEEELPKKRKKKARRNQFLDIEAGEADEGDEDDEEDGEDGWGDVTDELSEADLPRPEDYIRRPPPRPRLGKPSAAAAESEEEEEFDAEAEEERLRRLYGKRSEAGTSSGDGIPRTAMLMPKATDPKLWLVKCRPGRERDAVASVLRGLLELDRKGEEVPQVFSAVCRDTLKGYIYLEAFKPADIMAAIKRLHLNHVVFASQFSKPSLVPMSEMADVLAPSKLASTSASGPALGEVNPGDWVRVKRGKYAGDLAQVLEVPAETVLDNQSMIRVRLLPRLSYRSTGSGKGDRPPARPFDPQEAAQYGSVTKSRGLWVFAQEFYKDGFLVKEVKLGSLHTGGIVPRPDELDRFGQQEDDEEQAERRQIRPTSASKPAIYAKDDAVVIVEGELKGIRGKVDSVQSGTATSGPSWISVALDHPDIKDPMTFKAEQLQRYFEIGDQVRVQRGQHAGLSGMVVDVSENFRSVVVLSMASQQQVTVAVDDLQSSTQSSATAGPSATGQSKALTDFQLNDLVQSTDADLVFGIITRINADEGQLTIVDQAGTTRTMPVATVKLIDTKAVRADSASADTFKAGDRVQVDSAAGPATRPATILQTHRTIAFVKTVDTHEILVRRFPAIHRLGPHAGAVQQQTQSSRPVGGGRHLLGKSVTIAGGPYKGYAGIVKDVIDTMARVELHTNSKIINVDRDRLVMVDGSSERFDRSSVMAGGKTPAWSTAKTPAWGASKTPAWSTNASGKTPAWNAAASGKTPAWNASASGKTPAWNAAASGKTPAWNAAASGKTPAWNAGGKTPTWNAGGKTPTWNANSSGKTPAWNAAPTPAWNSASAPSAGGEIPSWAQQGVHVMPRGSSEPQPIVSVTAGKVVLQSGQSYRPADLEPAVPAKKDRVRVLNAPSGEASTGTVIGLDGPDAVVRLDDTASFRIVPISNLGRL